MKNPGMGMFLAFVLAAGWPGPVGAQESKPLPQGASRRAATTTRLVTLFSELETEWLQSVLQKGFPRARTVAGRGFP